MGFWEWYCEPFVDLRRWWEYDSKPTTVLLLMKVESPALFRPTNFKEYIGQDQAKCLLQAYINGTVSRKKIFPHTLIHGHAGCGKTALAHIIANELKRPFTECVAADISSPLDLILKIQSAPNGIIFVDEIHSLDRTTVEGIYTMMEEFRYNDQFIPQFTLIGATTELGEIIADRRPFYDRFKIVIELEQYNTRELEEITRQYKAKTFTDDYLLANAFAVIAANCRLTPRYALRLVEASVYLGDVNKALDAHGIIKDGFTRKDLAVLEYIALNKKGVGLSGLCSYLGTSAINYTHEIEPYLLQNKLVLRTPRGRMISELGEQKINELRSLV